MPYQKTRSLTPLDRIAILEDEAACHSELERRVERDLARVVANLARIETHAATGVKALRAQLHTVINACADLRAIARDVHLTRCTLEHFGAAKRAVCRSSRSSKSPAMGGVL